MLRICFFLILFASVASCSLVENYVKPQVEVSSDWSTEYPWHVIAPSDQEKKGPWWEIFQDTELSRLEELSLNQNPSLKIALNRIEQAKSIITISQAGLYPQADILIGGNRANISQNKPTYETSPLPTTISQNDFSLKLAVNYEVDLFDRIKNTVKASQASKEALDAQYENIKLLLTSEIASDYFALCEIDSEIDNVNKSIDLQTKALNFIKARYDLGLVNGIDLSRQQNQLDSTLAQLDVLQNQRAQFEHALAFLTGSFANDFKLTKRYFPNDLPIIPVSLPSDVLQHRPDEIGRAHV